MDLMEEWVHNANECIHLNLLRRSTDSGKDEAILDEPFHPSFTYPIFENEETIIGYKDPQIRLGFRANDLRPSLDVQYKHRMDLSSLLGDEVQGRQTDIDTVFKDFLPSYVFDEDEPSEPAGPDPNSSSWRPPGELRNSFETRGKKYEIWSCSMSDARALQIWRNMEILVLLYIEGASQLELDEDWSLERWTLHLVYEVTPLEDSSVSPYTIAGFSTSHRYWVFPTVDVLRATKSLPSPPSSTNGDATSHAPPRLEIADPSSTDVQDASSPPRIFKDLIDPLSAPSRERISQFMILPPYQSLSLGSKLYTTIFNHYVSLPNIYEIPVEDPSEAFDAMRDYADILYLRSIPEFASLSIASSLSPESLRKDASIPRDAILGGHAGVDMDALRRQTKIVARQFNRMVELHLLSTIPPLHRSTARISRKAKSSNSADRQYYFWRLAMKARIYAQNRDVLDQLEDPGEKVEKLEDAVNSQEQEYLERLDGIERRRLWAEGEMSSMGSKNEDATAAHSGKWERSTNTKRKRVVVEEDDGDEDWEDEDEGGSVGSKRPKV